MQNCNITHYYFEKDGPWSGILAAEAFAICSTKNRLKVYSPVILIFGRDVILPIKHKVDWELIRQWNQAQINKYNIR